MECQKKIEDNWKRMNNNKSLIFASIIALIFFTACSNKNCDKVIESIKNQCVNEKEECQVVFEKAFDLNWDDLYIFDSMLYPDEVSKALGTKYEGKIVPEGKSLFVFMYKGNIVRERQERCSDITFVDMKKDGVVKVQRENVYIAKRKTLNDREHYLLFEQ